MLDVGANADVKPYYMVQFAQMGSVYAERVMGIANPRVALLNIGGEEDEGRASWCRRCYERLRHAGVNFVGNIEGGEVHHNKADVIVTDGFTGNVAVKVTEGVADFIFRELRTALTVEAAGTSWRRWCCGRRCCRLRDRMDPGTYGGVPLLGVNGFVLIAHGNSNARAIKNAIKRAHDGATSGMIDSIRTALQRNR